MFPNRRISSNLTTIYRRVIPVVIVAFNIVLIFAAIFIFPRRHIGFFVVFIPYSLATSAITIFFMVKLRTVFYNRRELSIRDGADVVTVSLEQVISVTRYFYYFYLIRYYADGIEKRVVLLPHYFEVVWSLGILDASSIKDLRKAIRVAKDIKE